MQRYDPDTGRMYPDDTPSWQLGRGTGDGGDKYRGGDNIAGCIMVIIIILGVIVWGVDCIVMTVKQIDKWISYSNQHEKQVRPTIEVRKPSSQQLMVNGLRYEYSYSEKPGVFFVTDKSSGKKFIVHCAGESIRIITAAKDRQPQFFEAGLQLCYQQYFK